jgi:hypothetical protein
MNSGVYRLGGYIDLDARRLLAFEWWDAYEKAVKMGPLDKYVESVIATARKSPPFLQRFTVNA